MDYINPSVLEHSRDVLPGGWADPATPRRDEILQRGSYELAKLKRSVQFDASGRPLNPVGAE